MTIPAKILLPLAALGMITACATTDASRADKGAAELATLLEGRVAGEPQNCVNTFSGRNFTIIDRTALTLRDGDTIWVARTSDTRSLDDDDILLIEKFGGSRVCTSDQIKTLDRMGGFVTGFIRVESFVPWRKPEGS
ncbi:hypothetical protein [Paraurantiacibacter namhicola]|uniref:Lipoprotein n=1 Tax=Paraurantiacibacter namhicola TaxID=645517 RepID=A0A1C7D699_9SPHN|nr:hypothetical protein [Paraurantiacibacter namhicola]ANU06989.1 hypothetical protein A6F65_00667 [Paraurantiacibacter namhicola]